MSHSSTKRVVGKSADFPLWQHPRGYWAKKVKGRIKYFGKIADDPKGEAALEEWLRVKDYLLAGKEPPPKGQEVVTLKYLCNSWLESKEDLLKSGDLAERTFQAYKTSASFLLTTLGKHTPVAHLGPEAFKTLRGRMAKAWGVVRLKNEMGVVQSIFKYGYDAGLYDSPIRFGPSWKKPSAKRLRENDQKNGPKMFSREECLAILEHSTTIFKAMFLLGIQAGMGNTDLALMPIKAFDLEAGWLDYPRTKTAINRRIPLWPETVQAVKAVLAERREPADPEDGAFLFIGKRTGVSYVGNHRGYRITAEYYRVAKKAKISGRAFYDARRTFQTIGEDSGDFVAVKAIMGHAATAGDMSAKYRQKVSDERLRAVVDAVHKWLWPE